MALPEGSLFILYLAIQSQNLCIAENQRAFFYDLLLPKTECQLKEIALYYCLHNKQSLKTEEKFRILSLNRLRIISKDKLVVVVSGIM